MLTAEYNLTIDDYKKAARGASVKAFRAIAQLIKHEAIKASPKARVHRTKRSYPRARGIKTYTGERRISQTHMAKVKDRGYRGILAYVKVKVGYSMFVEYGKRRNARPWLRKTRDANMGKAVDLLKQEWPR